MEDHGRSSESFPNHNDYSDDEGDDFAALFDSHQSERDTFVPPDSKVEGTIVSIGEEWVFLDIGGKTEGIILKAELIGEHGDISVKEGDSITAYVVSNRDGEILLSLKMTAAASQEAVRGAYRSGMPVEGLVVAERKGGYAVSLFGKQAFCPYSQIDLQPVGDSKDYLGNRLTFRITEYTDNGRNIVLSRRQILQEEKEKKIAQLREILKPGDIVQGIVRKLVQFGAFVDIGGLEGLVPMSELAWQRVAAAADVLKQGDCVNVRILDLDWANKRISLSVKQTLEDPWDSVTGRYSENKSYTGRITKLMNFGAFVELEPGIEGLIHISDFRTGRRINHPKEVVSEGDHVQVRITSVDRAAKRIGLEMVSSAIDQTLDSEPDLKEGDIVVGFVDAVKDYGVFVRLAAGKSGLIHLSEIAADRTGDLRSRFPVGAPVEVQVLAIDPQTEKISLSTKSLLQKTEESHFKEFSSTSANRASLGTLGDLLKSKNRG